MFDNELNARFRNKLLASFGRRKGVPPAFFVDDVIEGQIQYDFGLVKFLLNSFDYAFEPLVPKPEAKTPDGYNVRTFFRVKVCRNQPLGFNNDRTIFFKGRIRT